MLFYIGRLLKTKTKNVAILKFRLQSSLIALIFLLDLYDVRDILQDIMSTTVPTTHP